MRAVDGFGFLRCPRDTARGEPPPPVQPPRARFSPAVRPLSSLAVPVVVLLVPVVVPLPSPLAPEPRIVCQVACLDEPRIIPLSSPVFAAQGREHTPRAWTTRV